MAYCNISHQNNIQNVTDTHKEFFQSVIFLLYFTYTLILYMEPLCRLFTAS